MPHSIRDLVYSREELQSLLNWIQEPASPVSVAMNRQTLFIVVDALQLAKRSPELTEFYGDVVDQVIRDMQSLMPEEMQKISCKHDRPLAFTQEVNRDAG